MYEKYIVTFGGKDLDNERFTKDNTNFWLDYIKPKMIVYNHFNGYHPLGMNIVDNELTYEDVPQEVFVVGEIKDIEIDDIGIKAKFVLYDRLPKELTTKLAYWNDNIEFEHQAWLKIVREKLEEGKLGFSSDAMKSLSRRSIASDNTVVIESWGMPFVSLTHIPAEPRNINSTFEDNKKMELNTVQNPVTPTDTPVVETPEINLQAIMSAIAGLQAQITALLTEEETDEVNEPETATLPIVEAAVNAPLASNAVPAVATATKSTTGAARFAHVPSVNVNTRGIDRSDEPLRFQKALIANSRRNSGWEKEVKALGFNVGSAGGFTTQVQQSNDLIDMLRAKSIFINGSGASGTLVDVMPMNSDVMTMPIQKTGTTAYWVGENTAFTDSQPTYGQMTFRAKKLGIIVPISNELLADTSIDLENKIKETIVRDLQTAIDKTILAGSGVGEQPLGVRNTTGIVKTALNAVPTYENLVDMVGRLESADVELNSSARWLFNPRDKNTLRKMKDAGNNYIWTDTQYVTQTAASMANSLLVGYGWLSSSAVQLGLNGTPTDGDIYFGNWDTVVLALRNDISIEASNVAGDSFRYDQTLIRAMVRLDIGIKNPLELQMLTDVQLS